VGLDPQWIKNLAQVPGEVQRGARVPRGAGKSGKILAIPQRLALRWRVRYALAGEEREENIMTKEQSASPFLETVREAIRVRHYSIRTEDAYVWNLETTVDRFVWLASNRFSPRFGQIGGSPAW